MKYYCIYNNKVYDVTNLMGEINPMPAEPFGDVTLFLKDDTATEYFDCVKSH